MGNTNKNRNAQEILAERIAGLKAKVDENTSQNSQTLVDEDSIGKEKKTILRQMGILRNQI